MILLLLACATCPPTAPTAHESLEPERQTQESAPPADACTSLAWYLDCDADGIGRSPTTEEDAASIACDPGPEAPTDPACTWSRFGGDCDDGTLIVRPFVAEICDGRDNDCDTYADEDGVCG